MSTNSANAEKAVSLTRFLGRTLPRSKVSFAVLVLLAMLTGVLTGIASGGILTAERYGYNIAHAIFLIAIPALVAAGACLTIKRSIHYKKIFFLALASGAIYAVFYFLHFGGVLKGVGLTESETFNLLLLGNVLIACVWFVTARIIFQLKYSSYFFGLVTPTLNILFLLADKSMTAGMETGSPGLLAVLAKLYFACFVFLLAIYWLFWMVNAPMKRNFGVSMTDAASMFLAQWFEGSPKLEAMLDGIGENVDTLVGVLAFRANGKPVAVFISPHIHYGPFGSLGGSEFPRLIAERVEKETGFPAFVLHGCATHDFDPSSASELEKFMPPILSAINDGSYAPAKGFVAVGKAGTAKVTCLSSNGVLFAPLSRAPRTTEDVDFSVGLAIRNFALANGASEAIIADAHNAETGEITRFESGNPVTFEYMDSVADALKQGGTARGARICLGVAADPLAPAAAGQRAPVGGAGLKVAVFDVGGTRLAYAVFDANGVTPDFRRELIDAIRVNGVDEFEVLTTDVHSVNKVAGVLNPLGGAGTDRAWVVERTAALVAQAAARLEPVESSGSVRRVSGVRVFGVAQSSELLGTVNSVVAVVRVMAPLALVAATAAALWLMAKI